MIGLGTIINTAAIVIGGALGRGCKSLLKERHQETVIKAAGFAIIFMGAASTFSKMLVLSEAGRTLDVTGAMNMVLSLALGALIGELINIDALFERLGEWLKHKSGSDGDSQFVNAFVTASLTVCVGAMAIIGSIQDGIYGDYSILTAKAILDFVIILIMAASMGKGCIFSAVPVFVLQGLMTLLAAVLANLMTEPILNSLSMVGNILIACVGVNLIWPKTIRTANLLPALVVTILITLLPL